MILDKINDTVRKKLQEQKETLSPKDLLKKLDDVEITPNRFIQAIQGKETVSIIGEIKKASPSKGIIRADFDHVKIANDYIKADIQAMSILTETEYFKGNLSYLKDIANMTDIPLLRKDFIVDEYQIYEAKLHGASAILLIMASLSDKDFKAFHKTATDLGLDCLVETHNKEEVLRAVEYAKIIGINNRSLQTFDEDITTVEKLLPYVPSSAVVVAESAIRSHDDFKYLQSLKVDSALIGEAFMREDSVVNAVRRLRDGI